MRSMNWLLEQTTELILNQHLKLVQGQRKDSIWLVIVTKSDWFKLGLEGWKSEWQRLKVK